MARSNRRSGEEFKVVAPAAEALIESLRSVGYSVKTAIADLIDNSITARAKNVWLDFHWDGGDSYITLLDDGAGMDEAGLVEAMRPGSQGPRTERHPDDLGRFGLGLKTASFSQCRQLTVQTKVRRTGSASLGCWDLDYVAQSQEWRLRTAVGAKTAARLSSLDDVSSGTVVLWEKMDRLVRPTSVAADKEDHDRFLKMVDAVEEHLGMVFHRFLAGSAHRALTIHINATGGDGSRVRPWDPFLSLHPATYKFPEQKVEAVRFAGFVLPHKDRLSPEEFKAAGGPRGWPAQQGFYVYRHDRMLVPGGWLDLGLPNEEVFKLARIRIDLPNSLDREWDIDVKKSRARPPGVLQQQLRRLAETVRGQARSVFVHRGRFGNGRKVAELVRPWESIPRKDGTAYRIVRTHPLLRAAMAQLSKKGLTQLEAALRLLEETVPVEKIWLDATERPEALRTPFETEPPDEVRKLLQLVFASLLAEGLGSTAARQQVSLIEPFNQFPTLVAELGGK